MKQLIRITVGLTISCLIAAFVMGAVFTQTDKAKKRNQHTNIQNTMIALLGYSKSNPSPSDLKLNNIYRYIVEDGKNKYLGYMLPVDKGGKTGYEFLLIDLDGKYVARYKVKISPEKAIEAPDREEALKGVLKPAMTFSYADSTVVVNLGGKRLAYLLPGEFPGFKTFVSVMLALDPSFKILGLEIMENEEDPGLGGEIVQEYFKNQFRDKELKKVKELKVVKKPLPEEYKNYLETKKREKGAFSKEEIDEIRSKYKEKDIYALTGATISSRAVTKGVKGMVKKFAYRIKILDGVIEGQGIPSAF